MGLLNTSFLFQMAQLTANRCGRIQAIVGPMFSGKSEELIRRLTREMFANRKVLVVKHCRDTRSAPGNITTHDGTGRLQIDLLTDTMGEVYDKAVGEDYDVVGIDEGQFFSQLAAYADALAGLGKVVIVAALDSNFLNHPQTSHFANVAALLPRADSVTKLQAICSSLDCGQLTPFYVKRDPDMGDGSRDLIGGFEKYRPICRACHTKPDPGPEFDIPAVISRRRSTDTKTPTTTAGKEEADPPAGKSKLTQTQASPEEESEPTSTNEKPKLNQVPAAPAEAAPPNKKPKPNQASPKSQPGPSSANILSEQECLDIISGTELQDPETDQQEQESQTKFSASDSGFLDEVKDEDEYWDDIEDDSFLDEALTAAEKNQ